MEHRKNKWVGYHEKSTTEGHEKEINSRTDWRPGKNKKGQKEFQTRSDARRIQYGGMIRFELNRRPLEVMGASAVVW